MNETKWKIKSPEIDLIGFNFNTYEKENHLYIESEDNKYSVINLESTKRRCEGRMQYHINVDIESENAEVRILTNWYDKDEKLKYRKYINKDDKIISPLDMEYMSISITICTENKGRAKVGGIIFEKIKEEPLKKVTLSSIYGCCTSMKKLNSTKEIMDIYEKEIDNLCNKEHPDLVVLTEHFHNLSRKPIPKNEKFITEDSFVLDIIKKKAVKHNTFIGGSYHIIDDKGIHNRAILIDRKGNIIARYDKIHLTIGEYEMGLIPGNDVVTVDTEIGKIGFMICWDAWYPEYARLLQLKNCDIIINPTRGEGTPQVNAVSYISGAYLVSAGESETITRIQDKYGNSLDDATDKKGYAVATVEINRPGWVPYLSVGAANGEGKNVFEYERRPELYKELIRKV